MSDQTQIPDPSTLLRQLQTDGYVIIRSLLPPELVASLLAATREVTSLARAGKWPHVRTVGKQFPPWDASLAVRDGIWGVQHLMHPSLGPRSALFAQLYFNPALLSVCSALLQCGPEELVMELLNLLVDPPKSFALSWHRDDIPWESTAEQEMEVLSRKGYDRHTQYNLSLADGDESLVVVPGSHLRARTEEERRGDMGGKEVRARLDSGDVVFYDNNILHRGVYEAGRERMTLHGSVGHVDGAKSRARNVLQHGIGEWVEGCDFSCLGDGEQRETAEGMRKRLLEMGKEAGDVGYSLQG
ncbi:hypothetical protein QBC42DRAFT_350512 [Cladorrhinum samala]|uniref:Phytanoyl-CoA dioxygenase family protein n=1 Tax=Cladorrhinum samala TaxID=585594 RepID=A0AAV9HBQ3_9PEZI|nr:hypothetical protein QBC42DRAFT_350512 [Cladorrhinum samala]